MPTYTASTAVIPNPERGFFNYTETHYLSDNSGHTALSSSSLASARTSNAYSLVFRYFVMEKYRTVDTIDTTYLNLIAADLTACATAGVKMIPRFTYSTAGNISSPPYDDDAPVARVLGHIAQLAPVLNAHAEVIDSIEAGFIGMWGEWYYTDNFGDLGTLTTQNWIDRIAVLNALYDQLDPSIFILVRYPGIKKYWMGP